MFSFTAAVSRDDGPACRRRVGAMLAVDVGSPPDGSATVDSPHASAGIKCWSVTSRDRDVMPLWDAERQLLVAGDVRLYNRPELCEALGVVQSNHELTDLELVRHAYSKWD